MTIYLIEASETVFYRFYVKVEDDNEDEACQVIYDFDGNLSECIDDADGFQIDKVTNLGDGDYLPEFITILERKEN
jgi:hypothetical protein